MKTLVCLFDIDGTLIESGGAGRAALIDALREQFGVPLRSEVDLHGRTDRWIGAELLVSHGIQDSEDNWRRLRKAYLRLLPGHLASRAGRVLPGVELLLPALIRSRRAALGLLTGNVQQGADIKLQHFGLRGHFQFGGFGDTHDCRNRVAAEALADARRHLGADLDGEQVWVIGDTPRDIDCARSIGARVAAVATGGFPASELARHSPDLLLDNLLDGEALISRL